jgi:hypothetical protein
MLADIVTDALAVAVVQIPKLEPLALRSVATGRVDDNTPTAFATAPICAHQRAPHRVLTGGLNGKTY